MTGSVEAEGTGTCWQDEQASSDNKPIPSLNWIENALFVGFGIGLFFMIDDNTCSVINKSDPCMEKILAFAGNHPVLVGSFIAVLVGLIVTELLRATRKFKTVSSADAIRLINREDAAIIDISANNDFDNKHIVAAINMPPSQLLASNKKLMKLQGRPVLMYCKTGQASHQNANKLIALGLGPVYVLRGGLAQWQQDQQPVV